MDLNLKPRSSRQNDRTNMVLRALELGYSTIAWNVAAFGKLSQYKPIQEVKLTSMQLESVRHRRGLVLSENDTVISDNFRQLSRITVSVEDVSEAQQLTVTNDTLKQFDIVAATPSNNKAFAYLCKQSDIDIIALDFTHRQSFPINKKLLDCAIQRGISFEIIYSPLFRGNGVIRLVCAWSNMYDQRFNTPHAVAAVRRQVLSNAKVFLQYLDGRNTIVSSGAEVVSHMRSPIDAVQLGLFLGISPSKARKTVFEHSSVVLQHAAARKQRYLPVEIITNDEFEKRWPELARKKRQSTNSPPPNAYAEDCDGIKENSSDEIFDDEKGVLSLQSGDMNDLDGFISLAPDQSASRDDFKTELNMTNRIGESIADNFVHKSNAKRSQDADNSDSERKVKKIKKK